MGRIGEIDIADRLAPRLPAWASQLGFGILTALLALLLQSLLAQFVPGAGPFAMGLPAVLLATLFGRWGSGAVAGIVFILTVWFETLPPAGSFAFAVPSDATRVLIAAITFALVIAVAETFRAAVRRAADERDRELAERDLLLEEFDHRVKNNFALVASLLDLQRRRAADPATVAALDTALARVESIARAHRHLYRGAPSSRTTDMAAYLAELCAALSEALFASGGVALSCDAEPIDIPRDRAVSIGLVLNELVTNAAKHAFEGRETGNVRVTFRAHGNGWRLIVADNGKGITPEHATGREGGLGQRLVEGFAKQAGGTVITGSGPQGTTVTVDLAA